MSAPEPLAPDLALFITARIDSVALLESLLLLRSQPERSWRAEEISVALRANTEILNGLLGGLQAQGMIQPGTTDGTWVYAPRSAELVQMIDRLADAYETRRVSVITQIYSSPVDKVRTFADAFRWRQEK